jgi:hypothetical protein
VINERSPKKTRRRFPPTEGRLFLAFVYLEGYVGQTLMILGVAVAAVTATWFVVYRWCALQQELQGQSRLARPGSALHKIEAVAGKRQ